MMQATPLPEEVTVGARVYAQGVEEPEDFEFTHDGRGAVDIPLGRPRSELGNYVREKRIAANLSQAKLSKASGLTQAQISSIECGYTHPTEKTAKGIARALKVPYADFWKAVCTSRRHFSGSMASEGESLVPVTGYVPSKVSAALKNEARTRGVTLSRVVAERLRASVNRTQGEIRAQTYGA